VQPTESAGAGAARANAVWGIRIARTGLLTTIGIVAGAAHSWVVPVSMRLDASPPLLIPATQPAAPAHAEAPGQTPAQPAAAEALGAHITLAQAKSLFDSGSIFVDAREDHERSVGTIAGSVHLTAGMVSSGTGADAMSLLDPAQPVVIYCAGGTCDASENLAILLRQAGFTRLHIFHDGFPAWKDAGFPVEAANAGGGS
jgi:rhodanese-related sulfurtransferase